LQVEVVHKISDPMLRILKREIVLVWNPRVIQVRPRASKVLTAMEKGLKF
jgi:hypothetical protein